MQYKGKSHWWSGMDDGESFLLAIVTTNRFAFDFRDDNEDCLSVITTSFDGITYKGKYGTRCSDTGRCEFKCFRAPDGELFFAGTWYDQEDGDGGEWFVKLHPQEIDSSVNTLKRKTNLKKAGKAQARGPQVKRKTGK